MGDWENLFGSAGMDGDFVAPWEHPAWYEDEESETFLDKKIYKSLLEWNSLRRMVKRGTKGHRLSGTKNYVFNKSQTVPFNLFYISKKNGKFRRIFSVYKVQKAELRSLIPLLEKVLEQDKSNVNYGFIKNRNCVENAMQHIGYRYTVSMDIEDFFGSVTRDKLKEYVAKDILDACLISDVAQQGLPTSPLLANIAFIKCDKKILEALNTHDIGAVYTRYGDDLTISFDNKKSIGKVIFLIRQIVESSGFKINSKKTKIQNTYNGRVIITGVGIDLKGVHPTRRTKKKLRAAKHQGKNKESIRGLEEWCKCRLPNTK